MLLKLQVLGLAATTSSLLHYEDRNMVKDTSLMTMDVDVIAVQLSWGLATAIATWIAFSVSG